MLNEIDIYRTASVLIRKHGEETALEAAQWVTPSAAVSKSLAMW